jgi:hypothetical protein
MTPPGLTPDDRDLIRSALGKVNKRIVMNILQKIESGGIPTPREMEILNASSVPGPTAAPAGATPPAEPELILESPDTPQGQAGIAAKYNVSVRKVKRWVAAGRETGDVPPLHSPTEMVAWAGRMKEKKVEGFKYRCPEEIEAAARKQATAPTPAIAPAEAGDTARGLGELDIDLTGWDPTEVNFDDGVAAAKMNFTVQAGLLRQAFDSKNPDKIRTARAAFKEALDLYREVERDRKKIMADQGELLRRDVIRREMHDMHSNIPRNLKMRLKDGFAEVPAASQSRELSMKPSAASWKRNLPPLNPYQNPHEPTRHPLSPRRHCSAL